MAEVLKLKVDGLDSRFESGTAAGGTSYSITLSGGVYGGSSQEIIGLPITITGGTGAGQMNVIRAFDNSNAEAWVVSAWGTTPDATSTYTIGEIDLIGYIKATRPWQREIGLPYGGATTQRLAIYTTGANVNQAQMRLVALQRMLEIGREYFRDISQQFAVFLHMAPDGETEQRALVYESKWSANSGRFAAPMLHNGKYQGSLAVTIDSRFEEATEIDMASNGVFAGGAATVSLAGGIVDCSGLSAGTFLSSYVDTLGGNGLGRIAHLRMRPNATVDRLWAGIRRVGTGVETFDPVWECEDASFGLSTDSNVELAVSGASSGDVIRVRFSDGAGTNDMGYRFIGRLGLAHPAAALTDFIGTYLVVMRYQVTSTSTSILLRLNSTHGSEWPPTVNQVKGPEQFVESDAGNWHLAPLGVFTIPAHGNRKDTQDLFSDLSRFCFSLEAQRLAGSGFLYADCFYLIPARHSLFVDNLRASNTYFSSVITTPDRQVNFYTLSAFVGGTMVSSGQPSAQDWGYPATGGVLVLLGENLTSHSLTTTVDQVSVLGHRVWDGYADDAKLAS